MKGMGIDRLCGRSTTIGKDLALSFCILNFLMKMNGRVSKRVRKEKIEKTKSLMHDILYHGFAEKRIALQEAQGHTGTG